MMNLWHSPDPLVEPQWTLHWPVFQDALKEHACCIEEKYHLILKKKMLMRFQEQKLKKEITLLN